MLSGFKKNFKPEKTVEKTVGRPLRWEVRSLTFAGTSAALGCNCLYVPRPKERKQLDVLRPTN